MLKNATYESPLKRKIRKKQKKKNDMGGTIYNIIYLCATFRQKLDYCQSVDKYSNRLEYFIES